MENVNHDTGLRILMLKSSERLISDIDKSLRHSGIDFISHSVGNKDSFAESIRFFNPDVILADLDKINGELSEALRIAHDEVPFAPFICLSDSPGVFSDSSDALYDVIGKNDMGNLIHTMKKAMGGVKEHFELKKASELLDIRLLQQSAIAELGQYALSEENLDSIKNRAVETLARALPAEFTNISEILPGNDELLVTAGTGWPEGVVGERRLDAKKNSRASWALNSNAPLIVEDINSETRFIAPAFFFDLGITSGISVIIKGKDKTYGVLSAHTLDKRFFSVDDINFLQSISNILASAYDRYFADLALKGSESLYRIMFNNSPLPMWVWDFETLMFLDVNEAAIKLYGYSKAEFLSMNVKDIRYDDDRISLVAQAGLHNITPTSEQGVWKHLKKDGTLFYVDITSHLLDYNGSRARLALINDVTEKRHAEMALIESEERFRLISESMRDLICLHNLDGTYKYVSPSVKEMLGYSPEELIGLLPDKIYYPEDVEKVEKNRIEILKGEKDVQIDYRICKKDGSYIWVETLTRVIKDENGNVLHLQTSTRDITERKKAEDIVIEKEANLTALTEHTEDAIWSVGADHKVITLNPAYKLLYYATNGIHLEKGMNIFAHRAENVQGALDNFNRVMNGEKLRFERKYVVQDLLKYYEVTVSPIHTKAGTITGAAYFSRDITQRKLAEDKIKKSEERYRKLIETMHEGVMYVDNKDTILFANGRFCEITGYSFEELNNRVASEFLISDKDKGLVEGKIRLRLQGIGDQYEMQLVRKSGETIWTMVNGIPITNENGDIIGSMATFTDITEIKKTESRLKALNKELNTFVYKSSHDLKGPLASIKGLTNLAKNEITDPESCHYFELIRQSATRLDSILSDLLETVRIKENAIVVEEIELEPLVHSIIGKLSSTKGFDNMEISVGVNIDFPFVSDRKILSSVIQNLIDNSIKYRDVNKNSNLINITIDERHFGIRMIVFDNGVGVPEYIHDKVFDMFYRGNLESKGTGLGLYIAKNAVEKLGGNINMESEFGVGTTFIIDIPNIFE